MWDDDMPDFPEISAVETAALCDLVATAAATVLGNLPMVATFFPEHAAFVIRPLHHVQSGTLH